MIRTIEEKNVIKLQGFRNLRVYQLAYELAMKIFEISKSFPRGERYSLTDQIRRSSRSVVANVAEAYRKRQYPRMFSNKLADSDAEAAETQVWIDFSFDCGYLSQSERDGFIADYEEVGKMLGSMILKPERFLP